MSGIIARRYALALLNLAEKGKAVDDVATGLDDIADIVEQSAELGRVLLTPGVSQSDKDKVVAQVLAKIKPAPLVDTFVRYLTHKRRIGLIAEVRRVFHVLADERLGRAQATVTVSSKLSSAEEESLRKSYEKLSGKKITLTVQVDPSIIGGAVTRIGSTVWDGSLKNALESIRTEITHGRIAL